MDYIAHRFMFEHEDKLMYCLSPSYSCPQGDILIQICFQILFWCWGVSFWERKGWGSQRQFARKKDIIMVKYIPSPRPAFLHEGCKGNGHEDKSASPTHFWWSVVLTCIIIDDSSLACNSNKTLVFEKCFFGPNQLYYFLCKCKLGKLN